ncbi:MAG: tetratricopeptide repeat protein [Bacteroidota bacterium]|jgi:tetratricopeptide (TPR) repeat protein
MAEAKNICSSCGSVNLPTAAICDICGEDLTQHTSETQSTGDEKSTSDIIKDAPVLVEALPAAAAAAPRQRQTPQAPQTKKKNPPKTDGRAAAASASPLFSTIQWIAITIAAFILGGIVTASFLPSTGQVPAETQSQNGMTQQDSQPDLGRLNAAKAALDANPSDPVAILTYANALHDAGMVDQAIVQYKRYLEVEPDDPDARVDLGICYFEKQEFTSAIAEMEKAVAKHPEHQLGTYNLGIVNLNAGDKAKAREWFTRARDIDPASANGQNAAQMLKEQF